jgi:hypothetical protein
MADSAFERMQTRHAKLPAQDYASRVAAADARRTAELNLAGRRIVTARFETPYTSAGSQLVLELDDGQSVVVRDHEGYQVSVEPYAEWSKDPYGDD